MDQKEIIRSVAYMSNENQVKFYAGLKANGLTDDEIDTIKSMVFYYKLFEDRTLYQAVEKSIGEQIYQEAR